YVSVVERAPAEEEAAARLDPAAVSGSLLVFAGGDDEMWQSDTAAQQIQEAAPEAEVHLYPQAGHAFSGDGRRGGLAMGGAAGAVVGWGAPLRRPGPPLGPRRRCCTHAWPRGTGERWTLPRTACRAQPMPSSISAASSATALSSPVIRIGGVAPATVSRARLRPHAQRFRA